MAISLVGSATGTTTATLPVHNVGDFILVFAYRDGSTTAPSRPASFPYTIGTVGANVNALLVVGKYAKGATDATDAIGTFTNATSVIALIFRNVGYVGQAVLTTGTATTTVSFPTLTAMKWTDGTSYVVGGVGHSDPTTGAIATAPTGMTNITSVVDATDRAAAHWTNAGVASWSNQTVNVTGTAGNYASATVELCEDKPLVGYTNLLASVQDLSNTGNWTRANLTSVTGGTSDSDGTSNAYTVLETTATAGHYLEATFSKAASVKKYRLSLKVKAQSTSRFLRLVALDSVFTDFADAYFDRANGTGAGNSTGAGFTLHGHGVRQCANSFVECYIDFTSDADTALKIDLKIANTTPADSYTGTATVGLQMYNPALYDFAEGIAAPTVPVQVGSTQIITLSSSATTGTASSTITVPSDATLVVVTFIGFDDVANNHTSLTFTKGGVDTTMTRIAGGDANTTATQIVPFYLALPDTGTNKSLKWSWSTTENDPGLHFFIRFYKNVDTASPIRASGAVQIGFTAPPQYSSMFQSVAGDLIEAVIGGFLTSNISEGSATLSNLTAEQETFTSGNNFDSVGGTLIPTTGGNIIGVASKTNWDDYGYGYVVLKPGANPSAGVSLPPYTPYSAFQHMIVR